MKKLSASIALFILVIFNSIYSQNRQVLYGFDHIPQTLLLNPGGEVDYRYSIGIPLLSGISLEAGMSELAVADLFSADGEDINIKLRNTLDRITSNDYLQINSQTEIINIGYRLDHQYFISAGFYTEIDVFGNVPKDVLTLLNEGNGAYVNKQFSFSQGNFKAEAFGVLHFGVSKKINEKLNLGTRFKVYSGIANLTTSNNTGTFTTRLGEDNIYRHFLNDITIAAYSSGIYDKNNQTIKPNVLLGRSFFGGNLGVGIDIGFSYKVNTNTEITASLLDIGFIEYSEDNRNVRINGTYSISGIEFQYDGSTSNYWEDIKNDFKSKLPSEKHREVYSVIRPIKFNSSVKHSWGKRRKEESCVDTSYYDYFDNGIGVQLFSVFRPTGPKFAFTGFYEKNF